MSGAWAGKSIEQRLFGRCTVTPEGCWVWQGGVDSSGYGSINFDGRVTSTHRVAYLISTGEIPEGMCILHSCDTPRCCNPKHLRAGTHLENVQDAVARGRNYTGGARKLTEAAVREIRYLYDKGASPTEIASLYDVTAATICKIGLRQTWRALQ